MAYLNVDIMASSMYSNYRSRKGKGNLLYGRLYHSQCEPVCIMDERLCSHGTGERGLFVTCEGIVNRAFL